MAVNTRRLRYFLAVAEFGHFGCAAATLHVSPAALSEQVRKLEDELGVRLLDRNPRGAQLTPIGIEVADRARAVLRETTALTDVVSRHMKMGDPNATREQAAVAMQPMNALPVPWVEDRDISNAVLFLASEEARYITGQALAVDAGAIQPFKLPHRPAADSE